MRDNADTSPEKSSGAGHGLARSARHWARYQKATLLLAGLSSRCGFVHPCQLRFFRWRSSPLAYHHFSGRTSSAARFFRFRRMVADARDSGAPLVYLEDMITTRTSSAWPSDAWNRIDRRLTATRLEAFMRGIRANQYERYAFFKSAQRRRAPTGGHTGC